MQMKLVCLGVILVILSCQHLVNAKKNGGHKGRRCGMRKCKAGYECVTRSSGEKECVCRQVCKQREFLVCGSDGRTYYNKCELHRIACVENRKLKIDHEGACPSNNAPEEADNVVDSLAQEEQKKTDYKKLPLVCYEIERDELRQLLVDWLERKVVLQPGKLYAEVVRDLFRSCDKDNNTMLDADELLTCTEKEDKNVKDTDAHILRGLCVDALINMGSLQHNWVLTEPEFEALLHPKFKPSSKTCQLEERMYKDGAETKVDCNVCVCACGDWVCTGTPCRGSQSDNAVPGPVVIGQLPSQAQRETFLNGFKASEEVYIPAVQDQVTSQRHKQEEVQQLRGLRGNTAH